MIGNAFIQSVFAKAKAAGFSDCEMRISSGEEFDVNILNGEILTYTSAGSEGVSFRGLYNGKMGMSSTQVYDDEAADQLVENALEAARLIENEDEQFLYAGDKEYPQLPPCGEGLENVSAADKIALAKELEIVAKAQSDLIRQTEASEVVYNASRTRIVNTKGLDVASEGKIVAAYVVPIATEGEKSSSGMEFVTETDFARLTGKTEEIAKKAVKQAIDFLHADSVPTGEYPILFRSDAAHSLLGTFAGMFSAENAQKGLSLLKGREGDTIAAACVTVTDDPLLPGSPASTPFDGEGVAARTKNVVENGVLKTLLHNLKTAHKQGVETTGNASAMGISVAPSNFFIQPGKRTLEEMAKDIGSGILVTDVQGLHAGANMVSGDFSLSAKGYRIENGEIGNPVEQFTVAGNFYKLLETVREVGSDLEFGFPGSSRIGSPSLWIEKLSVAGK